MSPPVQLKLVPSPPKTDGQLCHAFLGGDTDAFGELVRRHQETVFALTRRYTRSPDEAKDLAQRAFLQAFEAARRSFTRWERAGGEVPFRAWLLRIAINLGKNQLRSHKRWVLAPVEQVDVERPGEETPSSVLERAEGQAHVRLAVLELPKRQREVFTLRIDAGLAFAEVAQTLGITEGNAKVHFHHAVKRLKQAVDAKETP